MSGRAGAALSVRGLARRYGSAGLHGVDLDVAAGELLAIVGPSGGGKSTLLRLIAGLDRPQSGRIGVDGHDVAGVPPHQRGIGFTFDDAALYEHLPVRTNLALALDRERLAGDDRARRIDEALSLAGARHLADRIAETLSAGERRRVALARAVVRRPPLLLLDEPLGHLDRTSRLELRDDLRTLQRATGATAIVVTHEHEDALDIADRIAFLAAGRILQIDLPAMLWQRPMRIEVALGFGPSPMNAVPERDGWVAFRPEDLRPEGGARGWRASATLERVGPPLPGATSTLTLGDGSRVRIPARALSAAVGWSGEISVPEEALHRFAADGSRR